MPGLLDSIWFELLAFFFLPSRLCDEHEAEKVSISIFITPKAIPNEYLICPQTDRRRSGPEREGFNAPARISSEILKVFPFHPFFRLEGRKLSPSSIVILLKSSATLSSPR
jgi:hypothetical protein